MNQIRFILTSCIILIASGLNAQSVNFDSYKKVTDTDFRRFISLFTTKQLPLLCDEIVKTDIWHLKQQAVPHEFVDKYLMDGSEPVTGTLYENVPADGLPGKPVYGVFYPLYKLPTNGDYVLLVLAQVDDEAECAGLVVVLSFNLQGQLIYHSNYTYLPGSEYYNGYIDANLVSHHEYIIYRVNDELVFPPTNTVFTALGVDMSYQINPDGRSTKLGKVETEAQFKYSHSECRFKKIDQVK
jgi:hypothetical protein